MAVVTNITAFILLNKMIGVMNVKTITKKDKKLTITIIYNNTPSNDALRIYAEKLKRTIDSKVTTR